MTKPSARYLTVAAMVALAACGDDDSVTPDNLTEAEAQALATAVFQQSFMSAFTLDYEQQQPQAVNGPATATYQAEIETTAACPLGGEVALSAVVDVQTNDETGAGTVDFSVAQVHSNCGVQGDQGQQFTISGDPGVTFDFLMETDGQENFGFSGSLTGALSWATDGKAGTCAVSVEFSGQGSPTGFSFSNAGTVCGVDFSESVTISG